MSNNFFPKTANIYFKVLNTSPMHKSIRVFGLSIPYGQTIRVSLIKGELYIKIRNNDLRITESNIDLTQFSDSQKEFLISAGLTSGINPGNSLFVSTLSQLSGLQVSTLSYGENCWVDSLLAFASGQSRAAMVGSNNAEYGLYVGSGATVTRLNQATVTITGTSGDFTLSGNATQLPDLRNYADGYLPSLSSCSTWAELAAAPFNGKAIDYSTNAYIGP